MTAEGVPHHDPSAVDVAEATAGTDGEPYGHS